MDRNNQAGVDVILTLNPTIDFQRLHFENDPLQTFCCGVRCLTTWVPVGVWPAGE